MIGNSNFGFSSGGVSGGVPIGGGGTPNFIAKFTPTGIVINNSLLFDNGVTIGLGTITPNASALLDITSTTQGFLTPRMTQTERNAISTPATGLFIYNTTSSHFNFWDGAAWLVIESSTLTSDTLGQVLAAGNTTGGLPIIMTSGDTINFSVGSGGILNSLSTSVNQTWNLPDASGTIALLSNIPAPAPITINVIPKGTGTSITDGTWQFSGNDIIPTTTGSNIGDATHRIGTIFMASTFDYASDLNWVNGVNTHMTFTTTGRLGIGTILPLTNLNVAADNGTAIIASIRYSNDTSAAGFVGAKARGTQALPLPVLTGDHLCTVGSVGYTSAGVFSSLTSYTGKTLLYAAENFTATALGTNFGIFTTAKTTTIILERVTVTSEGLVGIGTVTPDASSLLDVTSTTHGFLAPRMTTVQKNAIGTPATSLFLFDTTQNLFNYWDGAAWQPIIANGITGTGTNTYATMWTSPSTVGDGTWYFSGNDYLPVTTGSNIGDATHRIGTIFMASVFDYASNISWINGVNTNMTFTTTGRLGIGTATPATKLHVSADDASSIIASARYSSDALETEFVGAKARGTQASPSAILLGDHISSLASNGHDGTSFSATNQGKISFYAAENFTPTAKGTNVGIYTVAIGTTTVPLERVTVTSEGLVGIGIITPITARLQVVGVDATVSNYGLKIQDNTTADLFVVRNDGNVYANGSGHITSNTAFGLNAFISNTTGTAIDNTAYGLNALQNLTGIAGFGGIANVALGGHALQNLINGGYSVAVGFCALEASQHDGFNTAVGTEAGVQLNGGNFNVYIGHQAGNTSLINSNQTLIGANATSLFDSTIVIGYHANATAPNQVIIGSDNAPANNYYFGSGVETGSVGFTGIHAITFQPSSVITFTDGDALDWYFNGAKSTGTGIGGNIIFQTAPSGVSGTTQNSLIEAMRIAQSGNVGIGIAVPLARLHNFGIDATTKINQRLEPVVGVTQDTSGDSTTTSGAVTSIAQTLAIPTDTVQYIVSTITYRKPIPNAGAGATGQGTTIKISVSVQNIGGVLTLDTIQNDYTGTVNAIAGVSATFLISGGTNVIVQVTGAVFDFITYNVISVVNTIS